MASDTRSSAVPIPAHLSWIEVVGSLKNKPNTRPDHFVKIYVDDKKVATSDKSNGHPLRWTWPEDHRFFLRPSSMIKIIIYRQSKTLITDHVVGQHSRKVFELLENDTTFDLEDKTGTVIASKIKINMSLLPESENNFKRFMETVDANVSRINSTRQVLHTGISTLGVALQLTKKIMDIVGGAHPILQASWTVMSFVYDAVQEVEGIDDSIQDLAENLREVLGVANERPDLLLIEGTTDVIEDIGRTSLKVASLIHEYTRPTILRRALNSQLSDDRKSRITQCLKSCDDLKQKFDRRVIMKTEGAVSEIKESLKTIKDEHKAKEIYQWLSAPDSSKNYHEAREKHQSDTFSWFLNGMRFREFQENADFLWIKGTAGCGKTVLCSTIIEKIIELHKENRSVSYAYFFFDGRDSQKDLQLHDKLIRSLILQLSLQCDGIPTVLVELYGHGYQQPSVSALQDILHHIISGLRTTYIDSLDECTEREKVLRWIDQITSLKLGNLHMVVASRPEHDITNVLQSLDPHFVNLATFVDSDIVMYLEQQLALVKKWDDETRNVIKSTLTTHAEGMFRWVALQLMELKKCPNRHSVMRQLTRLPKGLYETYDQILSKIDEQTDHTKTFVRWLCFSVRPMTLAEIAETVAVDLDADNGPRYTSAHRYWDEQDVLEKCSGLITESEGRVKLAHFSIKEYFLSKHLRTGPTSNFHLTSDEFSHALISQTCLTYLLRFDGLHSLDNVKNAGADEDKDINEDSDMAISFPLAHYAAEHWIFHAKSGGIDQSESSSTLTLAQELFMPKSSTFTNWINIWNIDKTNFPTDDQTRIGTRLYYAALAGLQQLSVYLLEMGVDVNLQGGSYNTALQAALAGGHEVIVKLLLKKGASVNAEGGYFGTALQAASAGGHKAMAMLLLEKGADTDINGGKYGTALHAASARGYEAITKLLLEKGANPNIVGGYSGTALQGASVGGYEVIVKLLLEKGANANIRGGIYRTPLHLASIGGHKAIVKLLLENGADANAKDNDGTALQIASVWGYEAIVKLLLEKGADANPEGRFDGTPLQAASGGGREGIVRLLLENGADANAKAKYKGTALGEASAGGYEAIVKLLLEKGADVNAHGGWPGTALQRASAGGHEAIVKLLLANGANPIVL